MNCEVTNLKSVIAAAIKAPGMSMDNMVEAMGDGYAKLMAYIAEQGKEIAGPPYCCYRTRARIIPISTWSSGYRSIWQ